METLSLFTLFRLTGLVKTTDNKHKGGLSNLTFIMATEQLSESGSKWHNAGICEGTCQRLLACHLCKVSQPVRLLPLALQC
ncbi:hypothetical protein NQZ68_006177 [Dissostichus eleginoides]|nr:hypothetical protein NQZ68_006177 [Dissostichus eleginoides]